MKAADFVKSYWRTCLSLATAIGFLFYSFIGKQPTTVDTFGHLLVFSLAAILALTLATQRGYCDDGLFGGRYHTNPIHSSTLTLEADIGLPMLELIFDSDLKVRHDESGFQMFIPYFVGSGPGVFDIPEVT